MTELIKRLEAILFAVGRAVSERELTELAQASLEHVHSALVELKKQYAERESPLLVIEEGDAWKLTVHEKYMGSVERINPHTELGKSILETLAVIAWKQPATQSDVIKIRTNKAYEHIGELERLGFVSKEKHGRTYYVKVTGKFFDYFDLPKDKGVKEIFKDIKDVEEVVQTKFAEQGGELGLETYGVKENVRLEKEGKKHVDGLEVFEDVETEEPLKFEEDEVKEENPVKEFVKENKKPAPQEEELETEKEPEEETKEEETEERELSPELEKMISKKKKE
ncbi:MAG: SMC-Scp complex subunit ScpB [Nanoarchaeota archaeon]